MLSMKKRICLTNSLSSLLAGFCLVLLTIGCSSDDDEVDTPTFSPVEFSLLDMDERPAKVFSEGDDICFDLTLRNNSDEVLTVCTWDLFDLSSYLKDDGYLVDPEDGPKQNIFAVYTTEGKYVGCAWDGLGVFDFKVYANSEVHLKCNWSHPNVFDPFVFSTDNLKKPLPAGSYYAVAKVKFGNDSFNTMRINFPVREKK